MWLLFVFAPCALKMYHTNACLKRIGYVHTHYN